MKRTTVSLVLIALCLSLWTSCSPQSKTSELSTIPPTKTLTATTSTLIKPTDDIPKYGGQLTIPIDGDPRGFEDVFGWDAGNTSLKLTHEELMTGDWAKGPAGTNQYDWAVDGVSRPDSKTGSLAESWEIPEVGTIIFHIRQGVHFALDSQNEASRLVNGREITADDIAFMLHELVTNTRATLSRTESKNAVITTPDKWTIIINLPLQSFKEIVMLGDYAISGYPREVTEKYGLPLSWQNAIGTGPFILTDYVTGSSMTLVRNTNYWRTDPVGLGKGNQLPYVDSVKLLIITDASTRLAAIRTAKTDVMHRVGWEDAANLKEINPEILNKKYLAEGASAIFMRTDKQDLPFKDIKVRKALMLATDFETIKNTWAGGDAVIITYPITYTREYADCYLSLEEAPGLVQEIYSYNPEKAKELLAEAGYPEGFQTRIICSSEATQADYMSIIKAQWSKVNIDLVIDLREPAVATGIMLARSHEQMEYSGAGVAGNAFLGANISTGTSTNGSYVDDPHVNETLAEISPLSITDPTEAARLYKELMGYVLEQAWAIPTPAPPLHVFWWPWVKNYHGEFSIGRNNSLSFAMYVWIDKELRKSMGH